MDEFIKSTPTRKKLLEILDNLQPYSEVRIIADKDGKFDKVFVEVSTKIMILNGQDTYVKEIWKNIH